MSNNQFLMDTRFHNHLIKLGKTSEEISAYIKENLENEIRILAYKNSSGELVYPDNNNLFPFRMPAEQAKEFTEYVKKEQLTVYSVEKIKSKVKFKVNDKVCLDCMAGEKDSDWNEIHKIHLSFDSFWFEFIRGGNPIDIYSKVRETPYVVTTEDGHYKTERELVYVIDIAKKEVRRDSAGNVVDKKKQGEKIMAFANKEKAIVEMINMTNLTVEELIRMDYDKGKIADCAAKKWYVSV